MNLKNKKGFTLIELLVVIAIIAVLAAVSIPVVIGVVQRAQDSAIVADIRSIHMQAVRIHLDTGNFNTIRCTGTPIDADIAAMCAAIDRANGLPDGTPLGGAGGNVTSHVATAPAQHFCIQSPLHGGGFRCADHTGHWALPATPAPVCAAHVTPITSATGTLIVPTGTAVTGATVETFITIDGFRFDLTAAANTPALIAERIIATSFPDVIASAVAGQPTHVLFTNRVGGTVGNRTVAIADNVHTPTATLQFTLPASITLSGGTGNLPRCR